MKSTTITSAYNQTSVEPQTATQNEDISISASMNSHGSFDWTCRKDTYESYGPVVVAQSNGIYKSTVVRSAYNQDVPGQETATTNQEVSVSASLNQHGSFDWTSRVDTYQPYGPELVASTSTPVLDMRHYVGFNNLQVASQATGNESSSMSVSMNQHGTFDTHEVVRSPKSASFSATFYSGSPGSRKTHRILVYKNSSVIRTLSGSISASAGAGINEFGLLDGSATAVDGDSGGGGGSGSNFFNVHTTLSRYERKVSPEGRSLKRKVTVMCFDVYDTTPNVLGHYQEAETCDFGEAYIRVNGGTAYAHYYKGFREGKWENDN